MMQMHNYDMTKPLNKINVKSTQFINPEVRVQRTYHLKKRRNKLQKNTKEQNKKKTKIKERKVPDEKARIQGNNNYLISSTYLFELLLRPRTFVHIRMVLTQITKLSTKFNSKHVYIEMHAITNSNGLKLEPYTSHTSSIAIFLAHGR